MSQQYFGLVTTVGLAKLAAAAAGGPALSLSAMAFGDGGGAETAPTKAATALVNERYRALLIEKYPHPTNASILYIEGAIPSGVGGWTLREAGIYDADGDLIVIAKLPALNVALLAEGASTEGLVRLPIAFDSASSVQMLVDPTVVLASQGWVLERLLTRPFLTVDSATVTAPPAVPTAHMLYLVPAGATGAWAGQHHKLAYYLGGWRFYVAPVGKRVAASDTGQVYRRTAAGWEKLWVEEEVAVAVEKAGIAEAPGSGTRLTRAVRSQRLNYFTAGGTANALTLALDPAPASWDDLINVPLDVRVAINNTAADPTLAPVGLGPKTIRRRSNEQVIRDDLVGGAVMRMRYNGTAVMLESPADLEFGRTVQVDPVLYVRPDGNDANDGSANTAAKAFATIAAAVQYGINRFYLKPGQALQIMLGVAGTYAAPPAANNAGVVVINGDSGAQQNYVISGAGAPSSGVISCGRGTQLSINGCTIQNTSSDSNWITAYSGGEVGLSNVTFIGTVANTRAILLAADGGQINCASGLRVNGVIAGCLYWSTGGVISISGNVTLVGTPAFTVAVANAQNGGKVGAQPGTSFIGGATGTRYTVSTNGIINTNGGGANFFPGNAAGSTNTGGQYV